MTTDLATMTRADMECAVLEYDILPAGTAGECAAISALTPLGYRATPLAGESGVIDRVEIGNSDPTGAKQASVGQWIVLDDGVLKVLTTEECDAMYEEVE